jgi:hypothetical protein
MSGKFYRETYTILVWIYRIRLNWIKLSWWCIMPGKIFNNLQKILFHVHVILKVRVNELILWGKSAIQLRIAKLNEVLEHFCQSISQFCLIFYKSGKMFCCDSQLDIEIYSTDDVLLWLIDWLFDWFCNYEYLSHILRRPLLVKDCKFYLCWVLVTF